MISYRLSVAVIAVAIVVVCFANSIELQWKWLITGGLIVAGLIFSRYEAPDGKHRRVLLGVLVDSRNKLSSSRLQSVAWTTLFLSAYYAAVFWNLAIDAGNALDVALPVEMWGLLGISTASLVGSPILKERKGASTVRNDALGQAQFGDVLQHEESEERLDIGKVQMLLFTLILITAYGATLWTLFAGIDEGVRIHELPAMSGGMVALLGISHAGYLGHKAVSGLSMSNPEIRSPANEIGLK